LRQPADAFVESFIGKNRINNPALLGVEQVMKTNPVTVSPDCGLAECVALMRRKKVDTVLVVDGQGRLLGGVDIEELDRQRSLHKIGDISRELNAVLNNVSGREAFAIMNENQLKYLPVVDNQNHLLGLVTRTSIVDAIASAVWGDGESA
jgi:osmoprotectant transport system ATP-binding protein